MSGRVTDNLSGVATLLARVDAGSFRDVAFDGGGNYSFATSYSQTATPMASYGSVQAIDQAGNVSNVASVSFVFDATAPVVVLTVPHPARQPDQCHLGGPGH